RRSCGLSLTWARDSGWSRPASRTSSWRRIFSSPASFSTWTFLSCPLCPASAARGAAPARRRWWRRGGASGFSCGLVLSDAGRAVVDAAEARRMLGGREHRLGNELLRVLELPLQALHVVLVVGAGLGVAGVRVAARAAREVGALGRVRARQRARRDAVAVVILVAAELLPAFQLLRAHHLAAVVLAAVVPLEGIGEALVHADVEVGHQKHRRLQALGEVERLGGELEALVRIVREEEHVL